MPEIIDLHTHMVAYTEPNVVSKNQLYHFQKVGFGFFGNSFFRPPTHIDLEKMYVRRLSELATNSNYVDRTVLLAMDAPADGIVHYYVPNDYVAQQSTVSDRILFGASVNPAKKDAIDRLREARKLNAVLNKILQNSMRFNPSDPAYDEFWQEMAKLGIPLLAHSGNESTILDCNQEYGNPLLLKRAIEKGVRVIISHCGAPEYVEEAVDMAIEHPNVYLGVAAMARQKRYKDLLDILETEEVHDKLVFETDMPLVADPLWFGNIIGHDIVEYIADIKNPYDQYAVLLLELGFDESILTRGAKLLEIPLWEKCS